MKKKHFIKWISTVCLLIFIAACSPQATPTTTSKPEPTIEITPTKHPIPTVTITPTPLPDLTTLGEPANPIVYRGFNPPRFLSYNKEEFYISQRIIHGRTVTIAWEKTLEESEAIRQSIDDAYFNAFITWWNVFGGFPYKTYTVVFHTDPNFYNPGEHGIGYETPGKSIVDWYLKESNDKFNHFKSQISHEVFHAWNNEALAISSNDVLWFREGVTMYYSDRYPGSRSYINWMNEHLNFYQHEMLGTKCDVSLVELGRKYKNLSPCRYYYYVYQKGALVSYMIDEHLIKIGLNVNDLMRYLYINYNFGGKKISNKDILEALNKISGEDWTTFFDAYIFGTEKLPLNGSFEYLNHNQ